MLTIDDQNWINTKYPRLIVTQKGAEGTIEFSATYNAEKNKFLILDENTIDDIGGIKLKDSYEIKIEERAIKVMSKLPALYIQGIEPIPDRHFNFTDKTACLCSPLEEEQFLTPNIDIKNYFEQLIIPFLYGQSFYTKYNLWAWAEYSHGPIGLLESYFKVGDSRKALDCLQKLSFDKSAWKKILPLLRQKGEIKGHSLCICNKNAKMRDCHKNAWMGLRQLHKDLKQISLTNFTIDT